MILFISPCLLSYFGAFQFFFQLHIPTLHQHFEYLDMQVAPRLSPPPHLFVFVVSLHLMQHYGFYHFCNALFIGTFLLKFRSQSDMYLLSWLLTLFSKNIPLEVAARLWDGHLIFGEAYLVCACLGVLKYLCVDL